jgi:hypothetical protein
LANRIQLLLHPLIDWPTAYNYCCSLIDWPTAYNYCGTLIDWQTAYNYCCTLWKLLMFLLHSDAKMATIDKNIFHVSSFVQAYDVSYIY